MGAQPVKRPSSGPSSTTVLPPAALPIHAAGPRAGGAGRHCPAFTLQLLPALCACSEPRPPPSGSSAAAGVLGDNVKVVRDKTKITVTSEIPMSKRYLKYLTKKYLKKVWGGWTGGYITAVDGWRRGAGSSCGAMERQRQRQLVEQPLYQLRRVQQP